jgi:hypothetical protein
MKPLLAMTPPKGDKKAWDGILNAFIAATEAGRAACEKSDAAALKVSLDEIGASCSRGTRRSAEKPEKPGSGPHASYLKDAAAS